MSHERAVTREQIAAAQDARSAATMPAPFAAAPLYLQDQQVPEAELTADEAAFVDAHKGCMSPAPILMSAGNPTGRKLEELLVQIRAELWEKNARLEGRDDEMTARVVLANRRIMSHLYEAEGAQRLLLAMLNAVGPDQGPLGRPRVGPGARR